MQVPAKRRGLHVTLKSLETSSDVPASDMLHTVERVSIAGCCRERYIILCQPAASRWLLRNPFNDNLITLTFQLRGKLLTQSAV